MQNKTITKSEIKRIIREILFLITTATLILSAIYAISGMLGAKDGKVRSDFTLMLSQCTLGAVGMILPFLIERYLHFCVPSGVRAVYFAFIYCAIFLGEVLSFYYIIPFWDGILHAASSVMLTALGISIANHLCRNNAARVRLTPALLCFFAFEFAVSVGVLWEIYEFSFDTILGLNMQKFRTAGGDLLIGKEALFDTMKDLIVDTATALVTSLAIYVNLRKESRNGYTRNKKAR